MTFGNAASRNCSQLNGQLMMWELGTVFQVMINKLKFKEDEWDELLCVGNFSINNMKPGIYETIKDELAMYQLVNQSNTEYYFRFIVWVFNVPEDGYITKEFTQDSIVSEAGLTHKLIVPQRAFGKQ